MEWSLHQADLVKINDEETHWLWASPPEAGTQKLLIEYSVSLIYANKTCFTKDEIRVCICFLYREYALLRRVVLQRNFLKGSCRHKKGRQI